MKKKNLLFLFMMLCTLSFFTACDDDDNEPEVPVLMKGKTVFSGENLTLTYGGAAMPGKEITFSTEDGNTGALKMEGTLDLSGLISSKAQPTKQLAPGVIPGEIVTLIENIVLTRDGDAYTFEGTDANDAREITYSGRADSASLKLDLTVKFPTNDLMGTWKLAELKESEDWGGGFVQEPVFYEWAAADSFSIELFPGYALKLAAEQLLTMGLQLSGVEAQFLDVLQDVTFREDGNIVATYSDVANIKDPQWTVSPLNIAQYTVNGNDIRLFLNIDMVLANIKTKASIADLPQGVLEGMINYVVPMLSAGVPLKYKMDGEKLVVYADTEFLKNLLAIFMPLLQDENIINMIMESVKNDPDFGSMAPMVQGLLEQLPAVVESTTKIELGINLVK